MVKTNIGKVIGRPISNPVPKKIWSLRDFKYRRNKILIRRRAGGLGDILMHRMIFEDIKLQYPNTKTTFACPQLFMAVMKDHPFIDEVVDCEKVDVNDFGTWYDTTVICGRTEQQMAPFSAPHRSDIWAEWIGLKLTRHNMHLKVKEKDEEEAKKIIERVRNHSGPSVAFSPSSAMLSKNLDTKQIQGVINTLKDMGYFVYGLHHYPILEFDAPLIIGKNYEQFISLVDYADYAINVDSAGFHTAGGLGKPQVGIFSWANGKTYGKWYENWELVQRHRDYTPGWTCGPCYTFSNCPKSKESRKPCITEITSDEIIEAFVKIITRFPLNRICQS